MAGTKYVIWFLTAILAICTFSASLRAQESRDGGGPPSIHFGEWLVVNPRAKIQLDLNAFRPELEDKRKVFQARRLRFGLDGSLFRDLGYTVRVETKKTDPEFRDIFLKYQRFKSFQLQAGRFKIPFGLDQLTDSGELDFVHRSRIGSIVAPGRDTGAMVLGDVLEGTINYSAGVFRHDGKNSEIEDLAANTEFLPGGNRTIAARATMKPAALLSVPAPLRELRIGAAITQSDLVTGLSSLPGVTVSHQVFFPRMYAGGTRVRRGAELSGEFGSLTIKGEFMEARDQRIGQGLRGENLPSLRTRGWYASAVQPVLGRFDKQSRVGFLRSILPDKGLGLLEATARYEVIRFSSGAADSVAPSRNPRAANVVANESRAWTLGMNWHASRYLKLQFNSVRETFSDPVRTPINGESDYWTLVARLQLYF